MLSALEDEAIESSLDSIPDPIGTFYRYGLPASKLFAKQHRQNA